MIETSCRSCRAPILWATTTSGKRIPLDAKPTRLLVLQQQEGVTIAVLRDCYQTHFATCPNAEDHRKPKPGADDG